MNVDDSAPSYMTDFMFGGLAAFRNTINQLPRLPSVVKRPIARMAREARLEPFIIVGNPGPNCCSLR
jgi:hypothetical protein